jgi:hypothetical protein
VTRCDLTLAVHVDGFRVMCLSRRWSSQHHNILRLCPHATTQAAAARLWVVLGEWSLAVSNMVAEGMADDLVRQSLPIPCSFLCENHPLQQVRVVRKIPAECKDAFEAAVAALRKLGKIDVAIDAVVKVMLSLLLLVCVLDIVTVPSMCTLLLCLFMSWMFILVHRAETSGCCASYMLSAASGRKHSRLLTPITSC